MAQQCVITEKMEMDVFVPSLQTAVEIDFFRCHQSKPKQDTRNNRPRAENGIILLRLRGGPLGAITNLGALFGYTPE